MLLIGGCVRTAGKIAFLIDAAAEIKIAPKNSDRAQGEAMDTAAHESQVKSQLYCQINGTTAAHESLVSPLASSAYSESQVLSLAFWMRDQEAIK
jgi:hypothetical protein